MPKTRSTYQPDGTEGPTPRPSVSAYLQRLGTPDGLGVALIRLQGDIDLQAAPRLEACLSAALERRTHLLLDMTEVQLIDCHCLGLLVRTQRMAQRHHTDLALVSPCPLVRRTLRATGLADVFPVFTNRAEALVSLTAGCRADRRWPFSGRRDRRRENPRPRRCVPLRKGPRQ